MKSHGVKANVGRISMQTALDSGLLLRRMIGVPKLVQTGGSSILISIVISWLTCIKSCQLGRLNDEDLNIGSFNLCMPILTKYRHHDNDDTFAKYSRSERDHGIDLRRWS